MFCVLSEEEDAKTTLCYDPVFITRGFAEVMETTQQQMMLLQKKPFCETVHPDDQQYVEESVRIRTLKNNKKANIPIVAMTANAFEEDKEKSFKAGMNAHITKPIDIKTILAVLDQVLGTSGI